MMTGYLPIYFIVALIMSIAGGVMLYCSWRYVENRLATGRTLGIALGSGFVFWFFGALILVLAVEFCEEVAIRWFGGNGFYFATIVAMIGILLHHQLLSLLTKK